MTPGIVIRGMGVMKWPDSHAYAIAGEVTTGTIEGIGFHVPVLTGETVKIIRLEADIGSGTSATVKLQKAGADVTGFTGLEAKTAVARKEGTPVEVLDKEKLTIVVTAVSGTPKNLSVTIVLERVR